MTQHNPQAGAHPHGPAYPQGTEQHPAGVGAQSDAYQGPWPSQLPSGTFPGMPSSGVQRPASVTVSFWLMIATGVLPLIAVPLVLEWMLEYMREIFIQASAMSGQPLPPGLIEQITASMVPGMWISSLVQTGMYVLLALGIRAGMNWVRIVATIFASLVLLSLLGSLALLIGFGIPLGMVFAGPVLMYVPSYAASACFFASVVVAWLPSANAYFAARRAARIGASFMR
ncbi:hypothetical protein [Sinomonas mesophila]|uniref:hypothetical protein n=1 Tax=Sinomonas mesophila TaxID=1531955 RepID=UPI0009875BE8|nr:hypothetical protein [Sinomonas mesophila]